MVVTPTLSLTVPRKIEERFLGIRLSKRMGDKVAGLRRLASDNPGGCPEFGRMFLS
jgi:hypothetical protein